MPSVLAAIRWPAAQMFTKKHIRKGICPTCLQPLRLMRIPSCEGTYKDVSVTFTDLPCLSCNNVNHKKWNPNKKFSELFTDVVFESGQLSIAKSGIFTLNKPKCFSCGEKLSRQSGSLDTISGKLSIDEIPAFSVSNTAPVVQCEHCSKHQIYSSSEVASNIVVAIVTAFKSENIEPQSVYSIAAG
jgi:hypothetical protein